MMTPVMPIVGVPIMRMSTVMIGMIRIILLVGIMPVAGVSLNGIAVICIVIVEIQRKPY
jgi:hypothetical protein